MELGYSQEGYHHLFRLELSIASKLGLMPCLTDILGYSGYVYSMWVQSGLGTSYL